MKKLLLIISLLTLPVIALAARFDFTNGQPSVMDDGEISDTFEQTRYDFTNGQPTPVLNATAVQAASAGDSSLRYDANLKILDGTLVIKDGTLRIY